MEEGKGFSDGSYLHFLWSLGNLNQLDDGFHPRWRAVVFWKVRDCDQSYLSVVDPQECVEPILREDHHPRIRYSAVKFSNVCAALSKRETTVKGSLAGGYEHVSFKLVTRRGRVPIFRWASLPGSMFSYFRIDASGPNCTLNA
jgi:hypothetical protein